MSLSSKAWDRFLNLVLRSDVAQINRVEWLTDVLYPFLSITELEQLATEPPHRFLSVKVLNHIANQEIRRHSELLAMGSAGSSLTGCVATWVGIPTELAQYSVNLVLLIQKLAYLYGWDDFYTYGAVTTETRARITFLMGSMLGIREADELLRRACHSYQGQVSITPMRYAGDRSPIDKVITEISKRLLVLSAKGGITAWVGRKAPLIGVTLGASTSYILVKPSLVRLKVFLRDLMVVCPS